MKNLLNSLFMGSIMFTVFYLTGAFACASFNLSDWHPWIRNFVAILALMMSFAVGYGTHQKNNF